MINTNVKKTISTNNRINAKIKQQHTHFVDWCYCLREVLCKKMFVCCLQVCLAWTTILLPNRQGEKPKTCPIFAGCACVEDGLGWHGNAWSCSWTRPISTIEIFETSALFSFPLEMNLTISLNRSSFCCWELIMLYMVIDYFLKVQGLCLENNNASWSFKFWILKLYWLRNCKSVTSFNVSKILPSFLIYDNF